MVQSLFLLFFVSSTFLAFQYVCINIIYKSSNDVIIGGLLFILFQIVSTPIIWTLSIGLYKFIEKKLKLKQLKIWFVILLSFVITNGINIYVFSLYIYKVSIPKISNTLLLVKADVIEEEIVKVSDKNSKSPTLYEYKYKIILHNYGPFVYKAMPIGIVLGYTNNFGYFDDLTSPPESLRENHKIDMLKGDNIIEGTISLDPINDFALKDLDNSKIRILIALGDARTYHEEDIWDKQIIINTNLKEDWIDLFKASTKFYGENYSQSIESKELK